ncbi:VWA domain-containing protein [Gilliamella apicola]|uniref:VWA containing CoxE family protein n=1 Tax=Gilliamella apicola TaxID=1196095 RepID=A0A242NLN1_9GAMM|nr:VWA domain-containing protein [Gilliamella apicola]OTP83654.1 VWA containing CoxE family protein [Gilliamella apicola]OTP84050.1 VWA containing CoxE family protein [Gilliamella apicola]OTP89456.1 VWA containing CoxE family protein [Gilliamella apicola]OTQ01313.1 VWA containing CoxE family protein [Gilliamella apicola]OTQ10674.1 VWA containing CoxE family protein [Gilliamella apicola]
MINDKQIKNSKTGEQVKRWRLILGQYADEHLNANDNLGLYDKQIDQALDYLYQHEYRSRGLLTEDKNDSESRRGGNQSSAYNTVNWLRQSRKLFPKSTFERMQNQAIERYQLEGILNDPNAVKELQPNFNSVRLLMSLRGKLSNSVQNEVKALIRKVVDEILKKIQMNFINAMTGKKNRFRRSLIKNNQNFDWRATIKANLKNFDQNKQQIIIEKAIFNSRANRQLPWDIILCVDQSGSMDSSIFYSAVCASIITQLPAVRLHLFVFDTQVVDLTHLASDPVEILMTVQLGGGTNIGYALNYAEQKIINPSRTVMVVVSDFYEGVNLTNLYNTVTRLNANRVKMLGLAALDYSATPVYDLQVSQELANRGMEIAALTPEHFATWLAEVMK